MENTIHSLLYNENPNDRGASLGCMLLKARVAKDNCLADHVMKSEKKFSDCWNYVCSRAKAVAVNNCAAVSAEDVLGWMVHFYLEDGKPDDISDNVSDNEPVKTENKIHDDDWASSYDTDKINERTALLEEKTGISSSLGARFARVWVFLEKKGLRISEDEISDWARQSVLYEGTYDLLKKLITSHMAGLSEPAEKILEDACSCNVWFSYKKLQPDTKLEADKKTKKAVREHDQISLF